VSGVGLVVFVVGILATMVWVGTLPDFRESDRIPEWFTNWIRDAMTAGVTMGVVIGLVVAAAYAFVLVVLARADDVFDRGSSPT
jgi:phosphotransferase system  glucose/maltose/N-acetylglucosamine-specific IIC component